MPKRDSESNDWAALAGHNGGFQVRKGKKRKIEGHSTGTETAAGQDGANGVQLDNKIKKDKLDLGSSAAANDPPDEQSAKTKKKHKKLKAEKEAGIGEASHETNSETLVVEKPSKGSSKENVTPEDEEAARKAEKKRRKAEKKAQRKANGNVPKPEVERGVEETSVSNNLIPDITGSGNQDTEGFKPKEKRVKTSKKAAKDTTINGAIEENEYISLSNTKPESESLDEYSESEALSSLPQSQIDDYLSSNFIDIEDPLSERTLRPMLSFDHLPSSARREHDPFATFKSPTPIQAAAWPFLLCGRDVVGVAETGSGKTLAFGIPCIRHVLAASKNKSLKKSKKPKSKSPTLAVIVSPTRELAVQIHEQIDALATPAGVSATCVYGGVPKEIQRFSVEKAHIITATPGRLKDLIQEGYADLGSVSYLVLDEADRMLDKGFEEDIKSIISCTLPSEKRQTLMFTATWPQTVRALASTFMRSPVKISIGENSASGELRANARIEQRVEVLDTMHGTKEARLLQLLKELQGSTNSKKDKKDRAQQQDSRILIFALYKKEAARIESLLRSHGHRIAGIHGDLSQAARTAALEAFKAGTTPLLAATDVAARGLDIPAVKAVVNVTFPLTVEDYVHRIGRTGRAGRTGLAVTFFTDHDKGLAGGLANVLRAAGQEVPEELKKFGGTVKKKGHDAYGAFYKAPVEGKKSVKITFDD